MASNYPKADEEVEPAAIENRNPTTPEDPYRTQSLHPESPGFLGAETGPVDNAGLHQTKKIGPYQLLKKLGEGGMGTVWMAEQTQPVKRRVALKLIKTGEDSEEIIARFDAERQALALMNHPNIARILDAGTTRGGQPFFVMELVSGTHLTTYCDQNRLGIDERLRLFCDVCSGVQHAHQKGIIHRDLKPGNIFVAMQDGKPVPKIIDFGLAKAMESTQLLTDQSLATGIGQILGTFKYMSPEQASLDRVDIDTRTDIYALGVVLYELLTGSTPLDDSSIKGQAKLKVLEIIRDQEALKPSSKLGSSTSEQKSAITSLRKTDGIRLSRILAGDLDWIVMKSLEKDRTRRYESASDFAADVRRYLNSEPVIARPPSLNYRVQKFVRKNRAGMIAVSMVTLALVGGIVGTGLGMLEAWRQEGIAKREVYEKEAALAEEARQRAEAVRQRQEAETNLAFSRKANEILGSVFSDLDPKAEYYEVSDLRNALRENLHKAIEELEGSAIGDPLEVASMQNTLGVSLLGLGEANKAIDVFRKVLETNESKLGSDHPKTLSGMNNLATSYQLAGQLDQSLTLHKRTLKLRKAKLGPDHHDTLVSMGNLAAALHYAGQLDKALPLYQQTQELMKAKLGPDHPDTLRIIVNLGEGYRAAGQLDKALPLMEQALEQSKAKLRPDHPEMIRCMSNLAEIYRSVAQFDKALPLLEDVVELRKAKLGADHPDTLIALNNLAAGYEDVGEYTRALPLHEEALKGKRARFGLDHPSTLQSMNNLALSYKQSNQIEKALSLLEEALALKKAKLGPDHPSTIQGINNLASVYEAAGQLAKALPLYKTNYQLSKAKLGPDHPDTLISLNNLALGYQNFGQLEKALPLFEEALALKKAKLGPDHPSTIQGISNLAAGYKAAGQMDKALPLYESKYLLSKAKLGADHPDTLISMNKLAQGYQAAGQVDKALPLLEQMLELYKAIRGPYHSDTLTSMNNLALAYRTADLLEKALPLYEKTLELSNTILGADHPNSINIMNNLAEGYRISGQLDKALPLYEQAALGMEDLRFQHHFARFIVPNAINAFQEAQKFQQSDELRHKWLGFLKSQEGPDSPAYAGELASFGLSLLHRQASENAETVLRECLSIREKIQPDLWSTFNTKSMLGAALLGQEKYEPAEPLLLAGYEGMKAQESTIPPLAATRIPESLDRLIELYTAFDKPEETESYRQLRSEYPPKME